MSKSVVSREIERNRDQRSDAACRTNVSPLEQDGVRLLTIKNDNGKEFADRCKMALVLKINFFFAKPYHS